MDGRPGRALSPNSGVSGLNLSVSLSMVTQLPSPLFVPCLAQSSSASLSLVIRGLSPTRTLYESAPIQDNPCKSQPLSDPQPCRPFQIELGGPSDNFIPHFSFVGFSSSSAYPTSHCATLVFLHIFHLVRVPDRVSPISFLLDLVKAGAL